MALGLFGFAGHGMTQVTACSDIQAAIVRYEISDFSLSSADGTGFILQNGINSCFDITVDGLQSSLEGKNGNQAVCYDLSVDKKQPVSSGNLDIRLKVIFNEPVINGFYQASNQYLITVNYN